MDEPQNNRSKRLKIPPLAAMGSAVLILVLGALIGFWLEKKLALKHITEIVNSIKPIRENNFKYSYIFPLLTYDFTQANPYFLDTQLDKKLADFVKQQAGQNSAQSISVYVRNFADNRWAGVNEDAQYHPGSMLKVLIMMAYFRQAQLDSTVLQKNLNYSQQINQQATSIDFGSPSNLEAGQNYSTEYLIEDMVANSDNGAETLLINNVNRDILNSAYSDLSIPNPDQTTGDYTISARQYAAFLRILYNATYLSEQYSERALSIMAKSTFKDGLRAAIPANVAVAHKFGERVDSSGNTINSVELHDCGIVYAPGHPYTLCIMTKGTDINKLKAVIKGVSSLVYSRVASGQ